jgi:hypothetical protein
MLIEDWQARHMAVRQMWKVEDLLKLVLDAIAAGIEVHENAETTELPQPALSAQISKLAYILRLLEQLLCSAALLDDRVSLFESEGYNIANAELLRQAIDRLSGIIRGVRGSLEEAQWQELDEEALSTQELLEVRDYLRSSGQASA